jgi:hypothetical protein
MTGDAARSGGARFVVFRPEFGEAERCGFGFAVSHPSHDEAVRRMGHPHSCGVKNGGVRVVVSQVPKCEAPGASGVFGDAWSKPVEFVVSHPSHDEAVRRMGHPHSCGVKNGGVRVVVSPVPKCEGPGAPSGFRFVDSQVPKCEAPGASRFLRVGEGAAAGGLA